MSQLITVLACMQNKGCYKWGSRHRSDLGCYRMFSRHVRSEILSHVLSTSRRLCRVSDCLSQFSCEGIFSTSGSAVGYLMGTTTATE